MKDLKTERPADLSVGDILPVREGESPSALFLQKKALWRSLIDGDPLAAAKVFTNLAQQLFELEAALLSPPPNLELAHDIRRLAHFELWVASLYDEQAGLPGNAEGNAVNGEGGRTRADCFNSVIPLVGHLGGYALAEALEAVSTRSEKSTKYKAARAYIKRMAENCHEGIGPQHLVK